MPQPPRRRTETGGIVTAEAVVLDFDEAGLGSRALAAMLDLGLRFGLLLATVLALGFVGASISESAAVVLAVASGFLLLLVYPTAFETAWRGRTPGKAALGLRVVTVEGAPITLRHASIRAALGMVDVVLTMGAAAVISALTSRRGQRLGDMVAGTIVVRERHAAAEAAPIDFQPVPGWEAYVEALDTSMLRPDAYALVRSFLLRSRDLSPAARASVGPELARRVAGILGAPFPPGTDAESFLVAVAAAHQKR